jgi:DNA-binding CsgD family transcriptional regulator
MLAASEALVAPVDQMSRRFDVALTIPHADRWPFELARTHLLYGEHLRRTGAMREARVQLQAALVGLERLAARPWAQRASDELRATGLRRSSARELGGQRLTPQELHIASLAATGLSNKQIGARLYLSPRTVGGHLYRVFPKLGVTSRAGLRDALDLLEPVSDAR